MSTMLNPRDVAGVNLDTGRSRSAIDAGRVRSQPSILDGIYVGMSSTLTALSSSTVATATAASIAWALESGGIISSVSVFRLNVPVHIGLYGLAANLLIWVIFSLLCRLYDPAQRLKALANTSATAEKQSPTGVYHDTTPSKCA